jgi:hypothetical protein
MKNYIGFVNDHSGSMGGQLAIAAAADYNAISGAIVKAATTEMQDTIVSVVDIGGRGSTREVTFSNPHVLKPIARWNASGGTPLYQGLLDLIKLHETAPDLNKEEVSFVIFTTTDGEANYDDASTYKPQVKAKIAELARTGRWTFVFRVPRGARRQVDDLGVPSENIQEWDTTTEGMKVSTVQTQAAVTQFYTARSAGAKSSNTFYAQAAAVDTSKLVDISPKVSVYQVGQGQMGILIRDFILTKRMEYLLGAAFYQLTKTESRVSPTKLILIREKSTGKVYAGNDARKMIGLDTVNNARLHPGDHGQYEIYIQSESWNRKLVEGSLVLYWAEQGRPMTQADFDKYAGQANVAAAPAVLQGLPVAPTNKPTPSPIPVAKKVIDLSYVNGKKVFGVYDTREQARVAGQTRPRRYVQDIKDFPGMALEGGKRWFLFE